MDTGIRTPLLDTFRRGNVPPDVRLMAAQGALAPRPLEQLELLILLTGDEDTDVARAAEATIGSIPREQVAGFLSRSEVPSAVRAFFQGRGIEPDASAPSGSDTPLVDTAVAPQPPAHKEDEGSALQRINALNVAQRMTVALKGSREERAILIRDPNKIVAAAVLSSPKLTETEVESISRMANVSEDVLRIIASTRAWVKNYQVVVALTKNPKTPVALSMNLLSRLNERDLRMLSTDRNVPDVLRITARKKLVVDK